MRTHKRQKTMSACSIHPPAHSVCSGSHTHTHTSACERPPHALPRRSLTRAPVYPAMRFLWDSTAATVRDDVAAQQGSGLLQWWGGLVGAVVSFRDGHETSWAQGSAGQTRYRCYFSSSMREDFSISFREEKADSEKARG